MKLLKTHYHPSIQDLTSKTQFTRLATRCIAMHGNEILLMYTARYDDYSLPGGGLDPGEDQIQGMIRELQEETGAQNIQNIQAFGIYEEYRPWYKEDFDVQHMISYCFSCTVDKDLGATKLEAYELKNGMKAVWVNINEAIQHNKSTIANSPKKGMSIERETFLLELIENTLIPVN